MIQEATCYEVTCDKCGQRLELDGVCAWQDEDEACDAIDYCNWQITDDRWCILHWMHRNLWD